jgi:hypothetical protein
MKKVKLLIFLILVPQIMMSWTYAYPATPVIFAVIGTAATGKIITVSGINLMHLDTMNWVNSEDKASFEGADNFIRKAANADGWIWNPAECDADRNGQYAKDLKLMGSKSAFLVDDCCYCPATISCCGNRLLTYNMQGRSSGYYAGYFRYSGSKWPSAYMKFILVATNGDGLIYFQPWGWTNATSTGRITEYLLRDNGGTDVSGTFSPPKAIGLNEWHHFELYFQYTSPKRIDAWIDGQLIGSINPNSSSSALYWDELGFPNLNGFVAPDWIGIHLDMITYSTSRIYPASKIEVSNSRIYGQGVVKWQEPLQISDTEIQVKLDLTGLGAGPYYLWITNNRQERGPVFPLSDAVENDSDRPRSPTGIKILN